MHTFNSAFATTFSTGGLGFGGSTGGGGDSTGGGGVGGVGGGGGGAHTGQSLHYLRSLTSINT